MTAEDVGQTAGLSIAGFARWGTGTSNRERNFYIALACAAILHASFFINAVNNGNAKRLGSETGADDAISVSLVTEQDLKSRATMAEPVTPPPGPPAPTQQAQPPAKPAEPPKPEEAKQEAQPEPPSPPQKQEKPQPDTPPDVPEETAAPDPVKPAEQAVAKPEEVSPESIPPDLLSLQEEDPSKMQSNDKPVPKPEAKPETKPETKKATSSKSASKPPAKAQKKNLAALDLSTPMAPSFGGGGGAAFQRPPGITRSGLNDAFARAVIRALQQTMPQLTGALGRVTVRILLSESGNVVEVKLLSGAKDPSLSQDVVFAAKQTSYPIPPAGSNLADRTFMVTYIYE